MAKPSRLFLVRHGETDGARERRFCGELDVPLNAAGRRMAEELGEFYADHPWAALYASPRQRTRDTVAPLAARTGLEVRIEPGLREIAYGAWEGKLEEELRRSHPLEFEAWLSDPGRNRPPGGESGIEIAERALAAVDRIRAAQPEGDVLCATHKATIRVLVCRLLGIDVALFRRRVAAPPGGLTVFELRDEGPLLLALADCRHLSRGLQGDFGD